MHSAFNSLSRTLSFSIALIALVSGCAGHGPLPSGSMTSSISASRRTIETFPSMTNARMPRSGSGTGSAVGPFITKALRSLPKAAIPARTVGPPRAPFPQSPRLNVATYGVIPQVVHSEDASFTIPRRGTARSMRQATFKPLETFTGNGAQDLTVATDGRYIFSTDGAFYIYTVSGQLLQEITHEAFYCPAVNPLPICASGGFSGDGRVIYDEAAQRWITSAVWIFNAGTVPTDVIGISTTSDPTGSWYLYQFPACGSSAPVGSSDQPHIGFNKKWIAVASACSSGETGLAVFDKSNLYNGGTLSLNANWFEFDDPLENGNRDNPVITYSTREQAEYLTASVVSKGRAAEVYSHIEGPTDAPVFYASSDQVTTGFATVSVPPGTVDAPGCSACIVFFSEGWTHSSGLWQVRGKKYILSTAVYDDPAYTGATQVISIAVTEGANVAKAIRISGEENGSGPMASEIGMPSTTGQIAGERALIAYDMSDSTFYPGVMAAQWNIRTNAIEISGALQEGAFTPTGYDASRWVDFISALVPVPRSTKMLLAGHLAASGSEDPMRSIYYAILPLKTP